MRLEHYVGVQTWRFECQDKEFGLFPDGHVWPWKSFKQELGWGDGREAWRLGRRLRQYSR